ncbi:MAG: Fe-S cluster assembly protein SufB [Candidatus Peribacteraceae bacterium]
MANPRASSGSHASALDIPNPAPYLKGVFRGLNEELIHAISAQKKEPVWMLKHRLASFHHFLRMSPPSWGPSLAGLNFQDIVYYAQTGVEQAQDWAQVPEYIRRVYDHLGVPQSERAALAGTGAQYESEVIYHNLKEQWEACGVIFMDMDDALQKHPDLVCEYFMRCVPATDHLFAALHGAVWSGGTFLYVPSGVTITEPLQAYFRMNAPRMGQFEHTLILVEEGAHVHYIEGCSAPQYSQSSLHAGLVEIFAKPGSHVRYSSVENWSKNTFNLNTKRAIVEREATMEWVGGNFGAGVTMLYPCSMLVGEKARCDHFSVAFAGEGQWQDLGAKVFHQAPHTSSNIVSKSVSAYGGTAVYRGKLHIAPHAHDCTANVECDALLLDEASRTDTVPDIQVRNNDVTIAHEARVGRLNAEDLFYLTSRGIAEEQAKAMIVNGFMEPIVRMLPLEYAVEMNRLIELEMKESVG